MAEIEVPKQDEQCRVAGFYEIPKNDDGSSARQASEACAQQKVDGGDLLVPQYISGYKMVPHQSGMYIASRKLAEGIWRALVVKTGQPHSMKGGLGLPFGPDEFWVEPIPDCTIGRSVQYYDGEGCLASLRLLHPTQHFIRVSDSRAVHAMRTPGVDDDIQAYHSGRATVRILPVDPRAAASWVFFDGLSAYDAADEINRLDIGAEYHAMETQLLGFILYWTVGLAAHQ